MIVGESWMTNRIHHREFDLFTDAMFEVGVTPLKEALESGGHDVAWIPAHEVQEGFPLHPDTWLRGKPTPNRLKLIRDWTLGGGALAMCGSYYSFQVINAGAFYHRTPIEGVLSVRISPYDDRVEVREGASCEVVEPQHPILCGIGDDWPYCSGTTW